MSSPDDGPDRRPRPSRRVHDVEVRREALTMALYVSITLLGALALLDDGSDRALAVVWGTTLGLSLAHFVAFELAARLADPQHDRGQVGRLAAAQAAGAASVGAVATLVVIVLPAHREVEGAGWATIAWIAVVVVAYLRAWGATWSRASGGAACAVVLGTAVAALKVALGH